jgi:hypothetical protein
MSLKVDDRLAAQRADMDPIQVHISEKLHPRLHLRRFRNPNPGLRTSADRSAIDARATVLSFRAGSYRHFIPRGVTARRSK